MKILKYILVFGVPAVVCGVGWLIGIGVCLGKNIYWPSLQENYAYSAWIIFACFMAAFLSSLFCQKHWRKASNGSSVGWAALHVMIGASLFGTCLFPVVGTIYGFVLSLLMMPVQIIGAYLHILLFRFLHARFLASNPVG